ncbi:MAG TPA: 50S ribosomal protein L9 [Desulfobacteraceae bacterium]|nr:50S ribosomal protein L9 [Desulfobacteraceae bacterium]
MQVILQQDFDELGLEGDLVSVASGYARNFLIPKNIALEATPGNLKAFELKRKKIEVKRLRAKEEAEKLAAALKGVTLVFSEKAGDEGKLYGSVTNMDIAAALDKKGIVIDRKKIVIDKPIKSLGEFNILVKVYPNVTGTVKVEVRSLEES